MKKIIGFILCLLVLSGCNSPIRELYPEDDSERDIAVYIISLGWHTGIAVETAQLSPHLPEHPRMPKARHLMFGWGDGEYYPHPDPGTALLLRAALIPTKSVLHVVGTDIPVERYFPSGRIVRIRIHESGAEKMARFIGGQFQINEEGDPVFAAEGLYRNSAFFEAKSRYFFPRTSNRWVAQALRRTGYPITPFYAFTSDNVMKQAAKYGEVIR